MANQPQCNFCAPAGSGNCKDCQGTQSSGSAKCVKCYGSGKCRHCDGTGLELSTIEKIKDVLLWLWVMSWFAFIGAFVWVGIWEYRIAQSAGGRVTNSCLVLMSTTIFLWVLFLWWITRRGPALTERRVGKILYACPHWREQFSPSIHSWGSYFLSISLHASRDLPQG